MVINAHTKIGSIIKERADALDAIISISPKFEKLRNPLLRKLMAARTSITTASKIGGCKVNDFFNKLRPLGFEIDGSVIAEDKEKKDLAAFMLTMQKEQLTELDVRPLITSGKDPLALIMQKIKWLKPGQTLKIVNSFYPEPLILLLKKQGFDSFADVIDDDLVETYFYKKENTKTQIAEPVRDAQQGWDDVLQKHKDKLQELDVRRLEMPLPMMAILNALDKLSAGSALFVYHKRIPVYLLPELADRKFNYRIKEIREGEVNLLIYKD
ncbi:DUF2249 domain-containing protein [Terrimonas pollutisoli]|uniref:DUF2249 domain-containing protein n=1 Tax=Terrimonas pollutisoli TaxID=3034147 RepID=UPI0023EC46DC|nr:DUF2249 domain-containing protein [Terrimonas sp. H1YJ31]